MEPFWRTKMVMPGLIEIHNSGDVDFDLSDTFSVMTIPWSAAGSSGFDLAEKESSFLPRARIEAMATNSTPTLPFQPQEVT